MQVAVYEPQWWQLAIAYMTIFCVSVLAFMQAWSKLDEMRWRLAERRGGAVPAQAPQPSAVSTQPSAVSTQPGATSAQPSATSTQPAQWWSALAGGGGARTYHLMIVGETGEGKSTAARALLAERAALGDVVIIDPHAKFNDWGGLSAIGEGRDFASINSAFLRLEAELKRRYTIGEAVGRPMTVFIDEFPVVSAECADASDVFKRMAREGRKAQMYLVVLTQDANVKTLGIEGEGPVRSNFARLLLGDFARKAGATAAHYPAALDIRGETNEVDSAIIPALAQRPVRSDATWTPPASVDAAVAALDKGSGDAVQVAEWAEMNDVDIDSVSIRFVAQEVFGATGGTAFNKAKAALQALRATEVPEVPLQSTRSGSSGIFSSTRSGAADLAVMLSGGINE